MTPSIRKTSRVDAWVNSFQTGDPYDAVHRNRRADGVYRWFQVRADPFGMRQVASSAGIVWSRILMTAKKPKRSCGEVKLTWLRRRD